MLFVLVFFSPFSISITSLGEERANLRAFRTFNRFALVWFCLFLLPFGVWEGLQFVILALPRLYFIIIIIIIIIQLTISIKYMYRQNICYISICGKLTNVRLKSSTNDPFACVTYMFMIL